MKSFETPRPDLCHENGSSRMRRALMVRTDPTTVAESHWQLGTVRRSSKEYWVLMLSVANPRARSSRIQARDRKQMNS